MEKDKQYWIEKFEAFLKENNCYEEFENNVKNCLVNQFETMYDLYEDTDVSIFDRIVNRAFVFYKTKNEDFWYELSDRWIEIYKNES